MFALLKKMLISRLLSEYSNLPDRVFNTFILWELVSSNFCFPSPNFSMRESTYCILFSRNLKKIAISLTVHRGFSAVECNAICGLSPRGLWVATTVKEIAVHIYVPRSNSTSISHHSPLTFGQSPFMHLVNIHRTSRGPFFLEFGLVHSHLVQFRHKVSYTKLLTLNFLLLIPLYQMDRE